MTAPIHDEIYEAIKREDFFKRLRRYVPFIILAIIAILVGTGGYAWWKHRYEAHLYHQEKQYEVFLGAVQSHKFAEAQRLLQEGKLTQKGFALLATLQEGTLIQEEFRLTHTKRSLEALKQLYQRVLTQNNPALEGLVRTATLLITLGTPFQPSMEDLHSFMAPTHSWHEMGMLCQALDAYLHKDKIAMQTHLIQWEQEAPPPLKWLPIYCAIGAGLSRPSPSPEVIP